MKTFRKASQFSQAMEYIKRITNHKSRLHVTQIVVSNYKHFPSGAEVGEAGESAEVDSNYWKFVPNNDINDDWMRRQLKLKDL